MKSKMLMDDRAVILFISVILNQADVIPTEDHIRNLQEIFSKDVSPAPDILIFPQGGISPLYLISTLA